MNRAYSSSFFQQVRNLFHPFFKGAQHVVLVNFGIVNMYKCLCAEVIVQAYPVGLCKFFQIFFNVSSKRW